MKARAGAWATLFATMMAAWLPSAAAIEEPTTIWDEDFVSCSDWTIASFMACQNDQLESEVFTQTFGEDIFGDNADHTSGPTFRSAAGSTWDKALFAKLKLNVTASNTGARGTTEACNGSPCQNTRIWDILIAPGSPTGISPPDNGGNALLFRRTENFRDGIEDLHQFEVYQSDDGTQTLIEQHNLPADFSGYDLNFNVTIDPIANRYWINWSVPSFGAGQYAAETSITDTWTDTADGWETEETQFRVTAFTFQHNNLHNPGNMSLEDMRLFGLAEPPPPPPPPAPHNPLKPDFAYQTGELGTQFYDQSVSPSEIIAWNWSFGDTYGSKRQHPFHSYACKGQYHVQLWVEDSNGEKANVSADIVIAEDRPLCGVIQRSEQGLTIVGGATVTIPTLVFGLLATISASTLAFGIDFNWRGRELISRRARVGLLVISVFFLLLQFGYLGFLEALVV